MMTNRIATVFLAITCVLLAVTTAVQAETEKSELVIAMSEQPPALDTHIVSVLAATELGRAIQETLVTMDEEQTIMPALAKSWEVSEDGKKYTFELREGVKFHNGKTLTAEDVVASMQRWSRLSLPGKQSFSMAEWSIDENGSISLEMPHASYKALVTLASNFSQPATIMPKEIIEDAGDKPVMDIIGTGPYKLKEWIPDNHIILEAYDDYVPFGGDPNGWAGDRTPQVNQLKFVFVSDESTRLMGLETGEYDIISDVSIDHLSSISGNADLKVVSFPFLKLMLIPNKVEGLFKSKDARQAINLTIDREDLLFGAIGDPQYFSLTHQLAFPHQEKYWQTEIGKDSINKVDHEEAKNLLNSASYKGEELVLITSSDFPELYNSAVVLQQQLKEVGIELRIDAYDWPSFVHARADTSKWDLMLMNNAFKPDPSQWVHLSKSYPGSASDPTMESILSKFETSSTIEEASQHYDELMAVHNSYLPAIIIGDYHRAYAASRKVEDMPMMAGPVYWRVTALQN